MLRAIEHDIAERGDIAAFLVGDPNLQVRDSAVLQRWQQHGPFFDSASIANPSCAVAPTCHQGKGSRIDFVFSSAAMYDASVTYQVHKLACFPTHSLVELSFHLPEASQSRRTQRTACSLPSLAPPSEFDRLLAFDLPSEFHHAISHDQVDDAYKLWSQTAENLLFSIAKAQGHVLSPGRAQRGAIKFSDTRVLPAIVADQASTLQGRRLFKALN